jgi:hypothetical protein
MPRLRRFDLEELVNRPGTYYNPQTEVLVVVDDSPEIDQEVFEREELDGDEWVLISDQVPIDEGKRDELIDRFHVEHGSALEEAEEFDLDDEELEAE